MINSKSVLICIFSYNVENYIENVFKKLKKYKHLKKTILFLNDCSTDKTKIIIEKIKKQNDKCSIYIINNKQNIGYGGNYKIAINFCIKYNFKKLIFLHGDDQYPANKIDKLILYLDKNDLVFGSRMSNIKSSRKNMPKIKIIVNIILTKFINFLFRVNYTEYFSGFRGFNLQKLKKINLQKLSNSYQIEQEIHYIYIKKKYKISEFSIPTVYEGQISRIPPIRYVIAIIFQALKYSLFKKINQ